MKLNEGLVSLTSLQSLVALLAVLDTPEPDRVVRRAAILLSWSHRNSPTNDFEWTCIMRHAWLDGYLLEEDGAWRRGRPMPVKVPVKWQASAREALRRAHKLESEHAELLAPQPQPGAAA